MEWRFRALTMLMVGSGWNSYVCEKETLILAVTLCIESLVSNFDRIDQQRGWMGSVKARSRSSELYVSGIRSRDGTYVQSYFVRRK